MALALLSKWFPSLLICFFPGHCKDTIWYRFVFRGLENMYRQFETDLDQQFHHLFSASMKVHACPHCGLSFILTFQPNAQRALGTSIIFPPFVRRRGRSFGEDWRQFRGGFDKPSFFGRIYRFSGNLLWLFYQYNSKWFFAVFISLAEFCKRYIERLQKDFCFVAKGNLKFYCSHLSLAICSWKWVYCLLAVNE